MSVADRGGRILDGVTRLFQFLLAGGEMLFRFFNVRLRADRSFSNAFEDFVGEHAAGHFGGGDLLEEGLVFAIAAGGVELDAEVDDFLLARLEIKLLAIDAPSASACAVCGPRSGVLRAG